MMKRTKLAQFAGSLILAVATTVAMWATGSPALLAIGSSPEIDVTGNANGATSSGAGGGLIAALVMALLALAGGDSK